MSARRVCNARVRTSAMQGKGCSRAPRRLRDACAHAPAMYGRCFSQARAASATRVHLHLPCKAGAPLERRVASARRVHMHLPCRAGVPLEHALPLRRACTFACHVRQVLLASTRHLCDVRARAPAMVYRSLGRCPGHKRWVSPVTDASHSAFLTHRSPCGRQNARVAYRSLGRCPGYV